MATAVEDQIYVMNTDPDNLFIYDPQSDVWDTEPRPFSKDTMRPGSHSTITCFTSEVVFDETIE